MRVFVAVAEAGSFIQVTEPLGLSKAAVSRLVAQLEQRLGVRLLHRTTRRLSLTEEGALFLARSKAILEALDEAESQPSSRSPAPPSGRVRVNAPVTFGNLHLAPLWGAFRDRYPQVTLDITLSDRIVDLVDEGYDLAIRIAALNNSSLVSRQLATTRMVLCASPAFMARHGALPHPSALADCPVIAYSYLATRDEWHFTGPQGEAVAVQTFPCIHTNSGDTCRAAALAHQGVILAPDFLVAQDLAAGTLVELLPAYRSVSFGIFAVYPTRQHIAPKVRALIDFLAETFATAACRGWA